MQNNDARKEVAVESPADWGTLAARAVDDISRVIQGEMRLLEVRLRSAIDGQVENIFLTLAAVAVATIGALCLLVALIGFLHQWMPYWEATGIVGLTFVIGGIIMRMVGKRSAKIKADA